MAKNLKYPVTTEDGKSFSFIAPEDASDELKMKMAEDAYKNIQMMEKGVQDSNIKRYGVSDPDSISIANKDLSLYDRIKSGIQGAALPLLPEALMSAPLATLASMGVGAGLGSGAHALGAPEPVSDAIGLIGGLLTGGATQSPMISGIPGDFAKGFQNTPRGNLGLGSIPGKIINDLYMVAPKLVGGIGEAIQGAKGDSLMPLSPEQRLINNVKSEPPGQLPNIDWGRVKQQFGAAPAPVYNAEPFDSVAERIQTSRFNPVNLQAQKMLPPGPSRIFPMGDPQTTFYPGDTGPQPAIRVELPKELPQVAETSKMMPPTERYPVGSGKFAPKGTKAIRDEFYNPKDLEVKINDTSQENQNSSGETSKAEKPQGENQEGAGIPKPRFYQIKSDLSDQENKAMSNLLQKFEKGTITDTEQVQLRALADKHKGSYQESKELFPQSKVEDYAKTKGINLNEAKQQFEDKGYTVKDKGAMHKAVHGRGSEKGLGHSDISSMAKDKFGVNSMKDLTDSQLEDLYTSMKDLPNRVKSSKTYGTKD